MTKLSAVPLCMKDRERERVFALFFSATKKKFAPQKGSKARHSDCLALNPQGNLSLFISNSKNTKLASMYDFLLPSLSFHQVNSDFAMKVVKFVQ